MVWRSRSPGQQSTTWTTIDNLANKCCLLLAWARVLATTVVSPCRTRKSCKKLLLAVAPSCSARLGTRLLRLLKYRANQPSNLKMQMYYHAALQFSRDMYQTAVYVSKQWHRPHMDHTISINLNSPRKGDTYHAPR